ncbi:sacsin N-terminal ATP-binding-like domain-containing protein [Tabrizicola oligotrophica]|uniref:DUF3883 domain-containing protein n=1 Tax=Tabrizicola oligotrophica TaxID=2710650 RepID=A0A6M0QXM0_9RHOB|nr:DUF3883 domain-containing protein [Tabrizicola oligotrophica]NEY92256.1 DUF3883 domain-containing protein [Tabrizicola oligotrophica]
MGLSEIRPSDTSYTILSPEQMLWQQCRDAVANAVDAYRKNQEVYGSLNNIGRVIGTEYGDRVLHELIQNAHDAHEFGEKGKIAIRLVVTGPQSGHLIVANGGRGFRWEEDVRGIINLASSRKHIGDGIGNKGLGFRSIEAITDDVQIYSRWGDGDDSKRFDGFCFRFGHLDEIEALVMSNGLSAAEAATVAGNIPRYLVPVPLADTAPADIHFWATQGFATVIFAPLKSAEAIDLLRRQIEAIADLEVPMLLFLDRISEVQIDVVLPEGPSRRTKLTRQKKVLHPAEQNNGIEVSEVTVGPKARFLHLRRKLESEGVLDAVRRSIKRAPALERWLDWKGQPAVSVAVGLSDVHIDKGRLYNFLPMAETAVSPFAGHLDAPFFSDIDRRNTDLTLPLNDFLLDEIAKTCVLGAQTILADELSVRRSAVFDLIAWTGTQAKALDRAAAIYEQGLRDLPFVPILKTPDGEAWSSLNHAWVWPEVKPSVIVKRKIVELTGAHIVGPELDAKRLERLRNMAARSFGAWNSLASMLPGAEQLTEWVEALAEDMLNRGAPPADWSRFYADLPPLFSAAKCDLQSLTGKRILLDRKEKLRAAGGHGSHLGDRVFVRGSLSGSRGTKDAAPLPPASISRRYKLLHERVELAGETLAEFVRARLVLEFDPVEALAGLGGALSDTATENMRRDALNWAFRLWRASPGSRLEAALKTAKLHVPLVDGWGPASTACFSASWSEVGQALETYLLAAAEVSPDCRKARQTLLTSWDEWPDAGGDSKRHWAQFLDLVGVADGLRPFASDIRREGTPSGEWETRLASAKPADGMDQDWVHAASRTFFHHRYTSYSMKGEAWRLPGQVEHQNLSETAKYALCRLVIHHLKEHGHDCLTFRLGRYERPEKQQDERVLQSPLAIFVRSKPWLPVETQDGERFLRPNQCWAASDRRSKVPKFVFGASADATRLVETDQVAKIAFSPLIGLQDWTSRETALERIRALATVCGHLQAAERPSFRRELLRSWKDVCSLGEQIPSDLPLVVSRRGQWEVVTGDLSSPLPVILADDGHRFDVRALSSAGQPVLEVGEDLSKVFEILEKTGTYRPLRIDSGGVKLLLDGTVFVPGPADPLLIASGIDWLPEVAVLANALRGENLERSIAAETIDRRIRSLRLRRCRNISLYLADEEVAPGALDWYAIPDPTHPTLVLKEALELDWPTLAGDLSCDLTRLIHPNLRSLERILLRLGIGQMPRQLLAPGDFELARALECDIRTVQDMRAELRTDLAHMIRMLVPVVGCLVGIEAARDLAVLLQTQGPEVDISSWLEANLTSERANAPAIMEACKKATDLRDIRRLLNLDLAELNEVLLALGEEQIGYDAELRAMFDGHLAALRPQLIDRLREIHLADFKEGRSLAIYQERKNLDFVTFNADWLLARDFLDQNTVADRAFGCLAALVGSPPEVTLPPLRSLVDRNRRAARSFAVDAISLVTAWCRKNGADVPEIWSGTEPQSVPRHLENAGLLDFVEIEPNQLPVLCQLAGCWPANMPLSIVRQDLGLGDEEIEAQKRARESERQQSEIEKRSIQFGGQRLDTADESFAAKLAEMAESFLAQDEGWYSRSAQAPKLNDLISTDRTGSGKGGRGSGEGRNPERHLTDSQREAVGYLGEWRAFQYLQRRFGAAADDTAWVSSNRAKILGGSEGNDAAGYDFAVRTPTVEWMFEVKSSIEDPGQFELTANEIRVASLAAKDGRRRYRILYVPYVLSQDRWAVFELPNPMSEKDRIKFKEVGRGSVRMSFERG